MNDERTLIAEISQGENGFFAMPVWRLSTGEELSSYYPDEEPLGPLTVEPLLQMLRTNAEIISYRYKGIVYDIHDNPTERDTDE